ncbi:MAG TPA: hypothetical protein VFY28_02420 [Candidatus Paceibacterota bacterium]|nr:hypothetical protein [Candidatus Paceibacterota bacterium]
MAEGDGGAHSDGLREKIRKLQARDPETAEVLSEMLDEIGKLRRSVSGKEDRMPMFGDRR